MSTTTYAGVLYNDADKDIFTQVITAGEVSLLCEFTWSVANQEQYDKLVAINKTSAFKDPIEKNGTYDRDYDYMAYYLGLQGVDLTEYINQGGLIPVSLRSQPLFKQIELIEDRIQVCVNLSNMFSQYKECMRWQVKVTTETGDITVAVVQPGGWFRNQDNTYSFRFTSDRDYIGRDDLKYVTIEVEVYGVS